MNDRFPWKFLNLLYRYMSPRANITQNILSLQTGALKIYISEQEYIMTGREIWSSDTNSGLVTLHLPEGQYELQFEGTFIAPLSTYLVLSDLTLATCQQETSLCNATTQWKCLIFEQCIPKVYFIVEYMKVQ